MAAGRAVGGSRPRPSPAAVARARARRRAAVRRRRVVALAGVGGLAALLAATLGGGGGGGGTASPTHGRLQATGTRTAAGSPSVVVGVRTSLAPWHLAAAVSREVVVPGPGGALWVLGGLDSAGGTTATSYLLDPSTGSERAAPPLAVATHDAAGTLLGSTALVVGGGSAAPAGEVQLATAAAATVSAQLPLARSDGRAVTVGSTAYVAGGYDGPAMDQAVLATTDGRSFRQVATLPVPVRYPTLATVGHDLYVLGGQDVGGAPVATVQRIDLRTGSVSVVGSLGVGLAASVATTVDGTVYLAGGLVPSASGSAPTSAIFAYTPGRPGLRRVATLPVPVANAGGTRLGAQLYVVGGEDTTGTPVDDVQAVRFLMGPRGPVARG